MVYPFFSSDLWAIGCIVFYLVAGTLAFLAPTDYLTFKKIEVLDYSFPDGFDEDARDLVERLLVSSAPFLFSVFLRREERSLCGAASPPLLLSLTYDEMCLTLNS